ncbi:hypothetical protein M5E87_02920 [Flavonifractor plautii]|nr:hypothetical protein M5E87_02920 [Flavonifractor plautii]
MPHTVLLLALEPSLLKRRWSRWAMHSPTANHFWARGKSSQLLERMFQVMWAAAS